MKIKQLLFLLLLIVGVGAKAQQASIVNGDFSNGNNGWTIEFNPISENNANQVTSTQGYELWNASTYNIYQTLNNIPNGLYRVSVQGFYRGGEVGYDVWQNMKNAVLYANESSVPLKNIKEEVYDVNPGVGRWRSLTDITPVGGGVNPGTNGFVPDDVDAANYAINTSGKYVNILLVEVTNNTLTLGVKNLDSGNNPWWNWTYFDNFTLSYLGSIKNTSWTNQSIYTTTENSDCVFWGRGANWGSQAIYTNNYEYAMKLDITVSDYIARFKFTDTKQYLFDAGSYNIYTDKDDGTDNSTAFYIQQQDGGYKFILLVDPNWSIGLGKDGNFDVLKLVSTNDAPVWNFCDSKANMSVPEDKYGTFCASFDVTLPESVMAYYAEVNAAGTKVGLTEVLTDGNRVLPAGTPVIIKNDGSAINQTFYGKATVNGATCTSDGNSLVGILTDDGKTVPAGAYIMLTSNEGVQQFHKLTTSGTGVLNRCYLDVNDASSANVLRFDFGDETAITTVEGNNTADVIYDLAGRKVQNAKKGLYIVNSKKVIR